MKPDHDKIALDLLLCRTSQEVCERNGISQSTFFRLKKDTQFIDIVREKKKQLFHQTMMKAQAYSLDAVEVLREVSLDSCAPASARVSAAAKIIEIGQNVHDQEEIVERLDDIERRVEIVTT